MQQPDKFITIIKENEGIIYKITRVYSRDKEDQKDLYQEIVFQLWKSFENFRGDAKISTWIYRIALNTSIAHLNKKKRTVSQVPINLELFERTDEAETVMEERMKVLYAHIKQLNVIEKGLILLYLEGKSYEEISTITGFSVTNVGTRLGRIKTKLKNNIKK